jgi:hydrogenase nickel incorporation protein HypA/HybF
MHELSLAHRLIEILADEMSKRGWTKVENVCLKIGQMTQILPDALRFGFSYLSEETSLEGAELIVETVSSRGRCMTCGKDFPIQNWTYVCPSCNRTDIHIISGKEFLISGIDGS